ncbi:hypothetical protein [Sphingomonas sp. H160509]|uniref:hypothetical protein n=1 Tax=Sphingomonas sp. H160509 TaxID=2955313 RepID=UPI00406C17EA
MTNRVVSPALAFAIAALGIGLFSMMDAVMKSLVLAIGVYNALLWRQMISVGLGAVAWKLGNSGRPSGRALKLHLARGLVTTAMAVLFFWGARAGADGASDFADLHRADPRAAAWRGDTRRAGRAAGGGRVDCRVARGAGGDDRAWTRRRGTGDVSRRTRGARICGPVCGQPRDRADAEPGGAAGEIAFFQALVITVTLALAAPWLAVVPEAAQWPKLILAAGLATASLWLLGWAYAHGDTGFLATTEYTSFVYAAGLGFLVFGERVSAFTLAGAAIIIVACLYAARRRDIAQTSIEASA